MPSLARLKSQNKKIKLLGVSTYIPTHTKWMNLHPTHTTTAIFLFGLILSVAFAALDGLILSVAFAALDGLILSVAFAALDGFYRFGVCGVC